MGHCNQVPSSVTKKWGQETVGPYLGMDRWATGSSLTLRASASLSVLILHDPHRSQGASPRQEVGSSGGPIAGMDGPLIRQVFSSTLSSGPYIGRSMSYATHVRLVLISALSLLTFPTQIKCTNIIVVCYLLQVQCLEEGIAKSREQGGSISTWKTTKPLPSTISKATAATPQPT